MHKVTPQVCEIEPLSAELWFARLRVIEEGELPGIQNSLRHAAHLAQLAPPPFRARLRLAVTEGEYESLLASEQFDHAARHLVNGIRILSTDDEHDGGLRLVTVSCIVLDHTVIGRGASLASAILDAWANGLLVYEAGMVPHAQSGAWLSEPLVKHRDAPDFGYTV